MPRTWFAYGRAVECPLQYPSRRRAVLEPRKKIEAEYGRYSWVRLALVLLLSALSLFAQAETGAAPPVGFFPGSFDPLTKGHYEIVETAIRLKQLTKVYVYIGPYGEKDYNLSTGERVALAQRVFDGHPETAGKVEVISDFNPPKRLFEITGADPNRTVYLLMGGDRVDPARTRGLPANVTHLIFPREGSTIPDMSAQKNVEFVVGFKPATVTSSTKVREAVAAGQSISQWVDAIAEAEIHALRYYQGPQGEQLKDAEGAFKKEARDFFRRFGRMKGWDLSALELPPFKATQTPAARREKLVRWIIEKRQIAGDERTELFEQASPIYELAHRAACDWAGVAGKKAHRFAR